jgi:hypothetical protein
MVSSIVGGVVMMKAVATRQKGPKVRRRMECLK